MFGYIVVARFMECSGPQYPPLKDMKRSIDSETKEMLLEYMKNGWHLSEAPTILKDVFTGDRLHLPLSYLCDGKYCWRSDAMYYMEHYGLVPEKEFVDYVMEKMDMSPQA